MKTALIAVLGAICMALGMAGAVQALQFFPFGEDVSADESLPLAASPNSNAGAAQADFLSLLADPRTEDFESFTAFPDPNAAGAPLSVNFGTITALFDAPSTLLNSNIVDEVPSGTDAGRYPVSATKYWKTLANPLDPADTTAFSIAFSEPLVAFGFFGTDIGDEGGGELSLLLDLAGGGTKALPVGNSTGAGGSLLYFGIVDTDNPFTKVTFTNTATLDFFAVDDLTIAAHVAATPVPEPGTLLLLGSGLAIGGLFMRRWAGTGA